MWRDRRLLDLLSIQHPILLAPMAGPGTVELAAAVTEAGGLGALPCAMLSPEEAHAGLSAIRAATKGPFNANFFCHAPPAADPEAEARWKRRLAPYYAELGLDPEAAPPGRPRTPFGEEMCRVLEDVRPKVVSFHFGLPARPYVDRLKAAGCVILSSATTVAEACWLQDNGANAVIAQGYEAGGHRGMFLSDDLSTQVGTFALTPQIVDAVALPVIAAGGIGDGRGFAAALMLGASGAQVGTAFLHTPEAKVAPVWRAMLERAETIPTAVTNVMTGRPARGLVNRLIAETGPISLDAPPFPLAANAVAPLRTAAEATGSADFTSCWAGQAAPLRRMTSAHKTSAYDLTRDLVAQCRGVLAEGA